MGQLWGGGGCEQSLEDRLLAEVTPCCPSRLPGPGCEAELSLAALRPMLPAPVWDKLEQGAKLLCRSCSRPSFAAGDLARLCEKMWGVQKNRWDKSTAAQKYQFGTNGLKYV